MYRHIPIGTILICFIVLAAHKGLAQNEDISGAADPIKTQMSAIAEENRRLLDENKRLKTKLIGLQLEVEKQEREIRSLQPKIENTKKIKREREVIPEVPNINYESMDDASLIKEAQDIYLSGQFMDLDIEQRFQELYLYDLQYQKQELQLDLEEKQALYDEIGTQRQTELDDLQREIQQNNEKEEEVISQIIELNKASTNHSRRIRDLTMENQFLREKIKRLKSR